MDKDKVFPSRATMLTANVPQSCFYYLTTRFDIAGITGAWDVLEHHLQEEKLQPVRVQGIKGVGSLTQQNEEELFCFMELTWAFDFQMSSVYRRVFCHGGVRLF